MSRLKLSALTLGFLLCLALPASADFSGPYDASNWTQSLDGGSIDLAGAPHFMTITTSNMGNGLTNQDFTITAQGTGLVSFDWFYATTDWTPYWDPFGYLLNGVFTQLTTDLGPNAQLGTTSFAVSSGDIFGFRASSVDSIFGSATTTVYNFSAPHDNFSGGSLPSGTIPNPEPSTMILLGTGLAGIVVWRRRNAR